jgi:integrase
MPSIRLKNIQRIRDPKSGVVYYYHRKTRARLPSPYGSPAFMDAWMREEASIAAPPPEMPGTLGALIIAYRRSIEYTSKATHTRRDYDRVMNYLKALHDMPLSRITTPFVVKLRDRAMSAHKRRFANYVVQFLSLLFAWGQPRGYCDTNPAAAAPKIAKPRGAPVRNRPWSAAEIEAMIDACEPGLRAAVALGVYTGMRESDVVALPWAAYADGHLEARQGKTGEPIWVPVHRRLKETLDVTPRTSDTIVTGMRGKPLTVEGFKTVFFRLRDKLQAEGKIRPGLTFHGARHTAATMLADVGCDERDIMAITGHKSTAALRKYIEQADRKARAEKAIRRLEGARAETE